MAGILSRLWAGQGHVKVANISCHTRTYGEAWLLRARFGSMGSRWIMHRERRGIKAHVCACVFVTTGLSQKVRSERGRPRYVLVTRVCDPCAG